MVSVFLMVAVKTGLIFCSHSRVAIFAVGGGGRIFISGFGLTALPKVRGAGRPTGATVALDLLGMALEYLKDAIGSPVGTGGTSRVSFRTTG